MKNVAIIGFGGIAQAAHVPAYKSLEEQGKARLVAVCDIDPVRFEQKMEINIGASQDTLPENLRVYTDLETMLEEEALDMVDICLPTFLHADTAVSMLERGYHVMSEKPMALNAEQAHLMVEAAKISEKQLMIGQCLRFSPPYTFIKKVIESEEFGKPLSASFRRMSAPPVWGWDNWFMDERRSGGCLLDMHIHDIDIARFLFGEPREVSCVTQHVYSGDDIVHSSLFYDGFSVLAIGDWSQAGADFKADYRIAFEKATVIFEGGVTVYPRQGEAFVPELPERDMYEDEIAYLVEQIDKCGENTLNPPESAEKTVQLIDTLRQSARSGGKRLAFE